MSNDVFTPTDLNRLTLRNRIIKAATFEGMSPGGVPGQRLIEHHREIARGGAAMTTVAYASISADGRSYDSQLMMVPQNADRLRELTDAVHQEGAAASIQLGHCGYFAERRVIGCRPLGPSVRFNTYGLSFCRKMMLEDIERVAADFAQAAELARDSGFDAVELHFGHGYLVSQFLSPFTNRRHDEFGGTLDNRLRFPLLVLAKTRAALGPDFPILIKMNLEDGFDGGLTLDDAVGVAQALERDGADGLVLSGGFVSKTPLYMLRGDVPMQDMIDVQQRWVRRVGLYMFGSLFVQEYPFEEAFFLEQALKVRQAVSMPLVLIGGITRLETMERALAAGFECVAVGRALLRDANWPNKLQRGEELVSLCEPCNKCIAEMDRGGVRCVHNPQLAAL